MTSPWTSPKVGIVKLGTSRRSHEITDFKDDRFHAAGLKNLFE